MRMLLQAGDKNLDPLQIRLKNMSAGAAWKGSKILNQTLFKNLAPRPDGYKLVHGLLQAYASLDPRLLGSMEMNCMRRLAEAYRAFSPSDLKTQKLPSKKIDLLSVFAELVLISEEPPYDLHNVIRNLYSPSVSIVGICFCKSN